MENNTVNTEILNDLIQINNDRVEGYQKAIEELHVEDTDLKSLFVEMVRQSHRHKAALVQEVQLLGVEPETGTTTSGKIYRAWMDVKAMFSGHDRETVLNNCEFGEDAAQKAYKMALNEEGLSAHLRTLITDQKADLKASHDQIKLLRDKVSEKTKAGKFAGLCFLRNLFRFLFNIGFVSVFINVIFSTTWAS